MAAKDDHPPVLDYAGTLPLRVERHDDLVVLIAPPEPLWPPAMMSILAAIGTTFFGLLACAFWTKVNTAWIGPPLLLLVALSGMGCVACAVRLKANLRMLLRVARERGGRELCLTTASLTRPYALPPDVITVEDVRVGERSFFAALREPTCVLEIATSAGEILIVRGGRSRETMCEIAEQLRTALNLPAMDSATGDPR